jgi:hypothetical protein
MASTYDPEIAAEICAEIESTTISLRAICDSQERFPNVQTFYRWMLAHPELRELYARAKDEQLAILADEVRSIADEAEPSEIITLKADGSREVKIQDALEHRRLRIDSRKWLLAKLKPKVYGDKSQQEIVGAGGGPIQAEIMVKFVDTSDH